MPLTRSFAIAMTTMATVADQTTSTIRHNYRRRRRKMNTAQPSNETVLTRLEIPTQIITQRFGTLR